MYNVEPCETPEGCQEKWPGQWFRFERKDNPGNWGKANYKMLALYVGVEAANEAIKRCTQ